MRHLRRWTGLRARFPIPDPAETPHELAANDTYYTPEAEPGAVQLVAIAAVAENGVIADDGEIPWDYPADKAFYRETIRGHPIIMGRKTFSGEPKADSTNIVLTRSVDDVGEGVVTANSVDEAVEAAEQTGADVAYVIGGQSVYESFIDRLDRVVMTKIPGNYEGDRYFPELDEDEWRHDDEQVIGGGLRVVEYVPLED